MEDKQVAIVIPVCKSAMNSSEAIAFRQALSMLRDYPIILAAPKHLDLKHDQNMQKSERKAERLSRWTGIRFRGRGGEVFDSQVAFLTAYS